MVRAWLGRFLLLLLFRPGLPSQQDDDDPIDDNDSVDDDEEDMDENDMCRRPFISAPLSSLKRRAFCLRFLFRWRLPLFLL